MVGGESRSRRHILGMLILGAAAVITGCASNPAPSSAAAAGDAARQAAPVSFPPVPPASPGISQVVSRGSAADNRIVLTVDDGTSAAVVAGYVDFAQRTGIHLTFSPNGTYGHQWVPHAAVLRPLIAAGQVQIINHTFTHRDLRKLTAAGVGAELERNDDWVVSTFGITTRPYYRPPFGFHNPVIDGVAAGLGYTRTVMWNGSFSDSETVTPEFLMAQAQRYLQPGVINLGHANHPTVLGLFDQIADLIRQRQLNPVTLDEMFGTSRSVGAA